MEFQFRASLLSNNGTDVDMGQIPEIYYRHQDLSDSENIRATQQNGNLSGKSEISVERDEAYSNCSIGPETLFSINFKTFFHLYRIFEWALKGCFDDFLLDVENQNAEIKHQQNIRHENEDYLTERQWRKERAGYVAVVTLRIIR